MPDAADGVRCHQHSADRGRIADTTPRSGPSVISVPHAGSRPAPSVTGVPACKLEPRERLRPGILDIAELVEAARGSARSRAPRRRRRARPSASCSPASRDTETAAPARWPRRRTAAGAARQRSTSAGSSYRDSSRFACTNGTLPRAWMSRSAICSVVRRQLLSSRLRPSTVMLSTPASIETQPARPSRSSIVGLHRSMRVCTPNLTGRVTSASSSGPVREEDLVDEVDVLDPGRDQPVEFLEDRSAAAACGSRRGSCPSRRTCSDTDSRARPPSPRRARRLPHRSGGDDAGAGRHRSADHVERRQRVHVGWFGPPWTRSVPSAPTRSRQCPPSSSRCREARQHLLAFAQDGDVDAELAQRRAGVVDACGPTAMRSAGDAFERAQGLLRHAQLRRRAAPEQITRRGRDHQSGRARKPRPGRATSCAWQIVELRVDEQDLVPGRARAAPGRSRTRAAGAARGSRNRCCRRTSSAG